MFRGLLKLLLLIVIVVVAGAYLLGWWGGRGIDDSRTAAAADAVRNKTAQAAEVAKDTTADAAVQARKALGEGSLTAKIKAKMALDDHVKALNLNVDTVGTVVTVSGDVKSEAERERALQLARDTAGVTKVVDKLQIRR